MIKLNNIDKEYTNGDEKLLALRNIDLKVKKGEFVAIMGQSGSGKSTLMNIIGLLDNNYEGEYIFEDESMANKTENELAEIRNKKIGFVFQHFFLIDKKNVFDNIALPLKYAAYTKKDIEKNVDEVLKKVGIYDKKNSYPNQLSGGQQQRVAIARALVSNPQLILADEPTGALDSQTTTDIMMLLKKLNKEGITIIIITHDNSVANYAQYKIIISDGEIIYE